MVFLETPFHENLSSNLHCFHPTNYSQISLPDELALHFQERVSQMSDLEAIHCFIFHGKIWFLIPF